MRISPIAPVKMPNLQSEETVDIVGPLCTSLDEFAKAISLPHAEIGNQVGVSQSGAYSRATTFLGFLSLPAPPEVWMHEGKDMLIQNRGT